MILFVRHTVYPNGTLYFPHVRPADEGSYRCEGLGNSRDIPAQTFTAELTLASKLKSVVTHSSISCFKKNNYGYRDLLKCVVFFYSNSKNCLYYCVKIITGVLSYIRRNTKVGLLNYSNRYINFQWN